MHIRWGALIGVLALTAPVAALSQTLVVASAPATGSVLQAGTSIPVRLLSELTTEGKHLHSGDRFNVEVSEPIQIAGQTVIPIGTRGVGEVTSVRNKGMWGKSGNIEARLLYIRVGDRQIRITGNFNDKGVTGTAGVVGAVVLVPVVGFFVTGTSARIENGAQATAFLDEDIPVVLPEGVTATPQPLVAAPTVSAPTITPAVSVQPTVKSQPAMATPVSTPPTSR